MSKKTVLQKKKKETVISLNNFLLENKEIQLKVFSNCIKNVSKNYYPPRAKKIVNLLNKIKIDDKLKITLGGCVIQKVYNNLVIFKEKYKKGLKI
jgi:hypothetical protein